jgi:excisionase family DNA binding protein
MSSYVMEVVKTDRNEEAFLSLSETARLLNVSERTIHRWIQDGRLPAYKPGRAYRFRMSDIEAFLEERRGAPLAEREPTPYERRREPKVVTGGAALRGAGRLRAEGFVLIGEKVLAKILERTERGEISAEEAIGEVHEQAEIR